MTRTSPGRAWSAGGTHRRRPASARRHPARWAPRAPPPPAPPMQPSVSARRLQTRGPPIQRQCLVKLDMPWVQASITESWTFKFTPWKQEDPQTILHSSATHGAGRIGMVLGASCDACLSTVLLRIRRRDSAGQRQNCWRIHLAQARPPVISRDVSTCFERKKMIKLSQNHRRLEEPHLSCGAVADQSSPVTADCTAGAVSDMPAADRRAAAAPGGHVCPFADLGSIPSIKVTHRTNAASRRAATRPHRRRPRVMANCWEAK